MDSGRFDRLAFRSYSAMSIAAMAWVATPLRPTDAPAHSSLVYSLPMSFGSSPMMFAPISLAWAYWAGPPARLE